MIRRLAHLVLTGFGIFIAIPVFAFLGLAAAALGLAAAVMLVWGILSFLGWIFLHDPNAGRSALVSFAVGGGALAILVVGWDALTGGWSRWKADKVKADGAKDAPFLELRTNDAA